MTNLYTNIRAALVGKRGAAMIEYALLIGLIAVAAIASINTFSSALKGTFSSVAGQV